MDRESEEDQRLRHNPFQEPSGDPWETEKRVAQAVITNQGLDEMPKKEEISFKVFLFRNFSWIAVVAMGVVNIWLTTKLAPLAQDINGLNIRVSAHERKLEVYDSSLERISDKIDKIYSEIGNLKQYCHP